ncbi:hypothetical protein HYV88_04360 [Candidatus Woesearchaeota archaeon]|nr:hypothetical protein [Candidatus Woesearchaeota archaeon]
MIIKPIRKEDKTRVELHLFLDSIDLLQKEEILNNLLINIPIINGIGYAGYKEKKWLSQSLEWLVFGQKERKEREFSFELDKEKEKEIKKISRDVIMSCQKYIASKLFIFVFPSFNEFAIKKMHGISGISPWRNTILISLSLVKNWQIALKETICHEIAHAISPYYNMENLSVGEGLIFDGIAEHFRETIVNGKKSPWTTAILKKEAKSILGQIKTKLNATDLSFYREVFFGTGKYPLWAGYAIGYHLVEDYLKKHRLVDWKKIINTDPKTILKEAKIK